jgi:predicted nucleic acid-binding protein
MIVVIDVNVVLSALMKDSTTREIIVKSGFDFCFPEVSLVKIRKYEGLILEKSGLSEREFSQLFDKLLSFIRLIPTEEVKSHWSDAKKIMAHVDVEDVVFVAAALSQDAVIWSEDRHFEKQTEIIVLKTKDIIGLLRDK